MYTKRTKEKELDILRKILTVEQYNKLSGGLPDSIVSYKDMVERAYDRKYITQEQLIEYCEKVCKYDFTMEVDYESILALNDTVSLSKHKICFLFCFDRSLHVLVPWNLKDIPRAVDYIKSNNYSVKRARYDYIVVHMTTAKFFEEVNIKCSTYMTY